MSTQRARRGAEGTSPLALAAGVAAAGGATAGAAWLRERRRLVADIDPSLRSPLLYLPFSMNTLALVRASRGRFPVPTTVPLTVQRSTRLLPASSDGHQAEVTLYESRAAAHDAEPRAAVLYIHGGGLVSGSVSAYHARCAMLAERLGALVVSVDYRLSPESPFPAGFDDCYTALLWLHDHAAELRVDPSRVAVAGDSAGGGLAASVAQRAHDERVPLAFQALIYPMLDDRTCSVEPANDRGTFVWTPASNLFGWTSWLGHMPNNDAVPPYAVAARRVDVSGLAPAWIGVGDKDLFYAEDVRYAERLVDAGVAVQLETVPGMYHGPDLLLSPQPPLVQRFTDSWVNALDAALNPR